MQNIISTNRNNIVNLQNDVQLLRQEIIDAKNTINIGIQNLGQIIDSLNHNLH